MKRVAALLALGIAAAAILHAVTGQQGLTASVFRTDRRADHPIHAEFDAAPSEDLVEHLTSFGPTGKTRLAWDGFLYCDSSREYKFSIATNGPARLELDGKLVLESSGGDVGPQAVQLSSGQHLLSFDYTPPTVDRPALALRWDVGNPYRPSEIPSIHYSPGSLKDFAWRLRRFAEPSAMAVSIAVTALLFWVGWVVLKKALDVQSGELSGSARMVLAMAIALCAIGIWWGLPASWAPDEIDPPAVLDALRSHFADGWISTYPPLHFYLLSIVFAPTLLAGWLGWLNVEANQTTTLLYVISRALSVWMAAGTLFGIGLISTRTFSRRHAWVAIVCSATFLPFVFYAKTVNVDVPYLFWFIVSVVFFLAALKTQRLRDMVGFGITAVAAIATKDQAYGLYILPAIYLAVRIGRSNRGRKSLAVAATSALIAFVVFDNLVLGFHAFREHLSLVTGQASSGYRMFPRSLSGQVGLSGLTLGQLLWGLGIPGVILLVVGLAAKAGITKDLIIGVIVLASASYFLTFISVVGYAYDRFLIPVGLLLSFVEAVGAVRLLSSSRWIARSAGVVLLTWMVWRALSIDLLLVGDSRYRVAQWLEGHVGYNAEVVSVGGFGDLPRPTEFRHHVVPGTIAETAQNKPDFIVVNTEFVRRFPAGKPIQSWLSWLESGSAPYDEVFRYKAPLRWSALAWMRRFTDRIEDDVTNVDKANPEIAIFQRRK